MPHNALRFSSLSWLLFLLSTTEAQSSYILNTTAYTINIERFDDNGTSAQRKSCVAYICMVNDCECVIVHYILFCICVHTYIFNVLFQNNKTINQRCPLCASLPNAYPRAPVLSVQVLFKIRQIVSRLYTAAAHPQTALQPFLCLLQYQQSAIVSWHPTIVVPRKHAKLFTDFHWLRPDSELFACGKLFVDWF